MLPSFSSDHLSLTQALYQRVLDSVYQSCSPSLQGCLDRCNFGIAPDAQGIRTFFIIAPNQGVAQEILQEHLDFLLAQISEYMVGITQAAICFMPMAALEKGWQYSPKLATSQLLVGRVFPVDSWFPEAS